MSDIRALFWDVGGVLLSNAWDHNERREAFARFPVDEKDFKQRHEAVVESFERGQITLDEYLDRTVFFAPRTFSREQFRDFMFTLSKPVPEVIALAQALGGSGKYLMATINNESRELNEYRVEKFGLKNIFRMFFSSCFVGSRKPGPEIYRLALDVTQIPAEQCCFIDDRAENLESPRMLGLHTIEMKGVEALRAELGKLAVG